VLIYFTRSLFDSKSIPFSDTAGFEGGMKIHQSTRFGRFAGEVFINSMDFTAFKRKRRIKKSKEQVKNDINYFAIIEAKFTDACDQFSKEEGDQIVAKSSESSEKFGVKNIIFTESVVPKKKGQFFGVSKHPNFEALQRSPQD
jgi:hypothetical protein